MSLAVRVIPCLDVDDGRVVKGVHFENLRDAGDPVELAAEYYRQGADELTFLDVTASSSHRQTMVNVVTRTAEQIFIPLTVGGGVRTPEDVDSLLRCGADKVSVNTAAINDPTLISRVAERFGNQCNARGGVYSDHRLRRRRKGTGFPACHRRRRGRRTCRINLPLRQGYNRRGQGRVAPCWLCRALERPKGCPGCSPATN